jgi:hypothetical protein
VTMFKKGGEKEGGHVSPCINIEEIELLIGNGIYLYQVLVLLLPCIKYHLDFFYV